MALAGKYERGRRGMRAPRWLLRKRVLVYLISSLLTVVFKWDLYSGACYCSLIPVSWIGIFAPVCANQKSAIITASAFFYHLPLLVFSSQAIITLFQGEHEKIFALFFIIYYVGCKFWVSKGNLHCIFILWKAF